ncbi:unnamed protein product [Meloidogyne enterolobii]|uniref:Uncharacterized protein n=1 Tax=Meloidogyne enterolobii TaxID=390850 RepID=A0ACB0Z1J2_MELEN
MYWIYTFLLFFPLKQSTCLSSLSCFGNEKQITSNISDKQINCVADYLLIERNLKAEIFIEKVGKEVKVIRGIPKKLVKNLKIEENEMKEFYEEDNFCFEENKEFVIVDENTSKKVLIVKYLVKNIKKKYLILSNEYQDFGEDN